MLFVVWPAKVRRLNDRAVTIAGLLAAEAAFAIDRADLLNRLERQASTDELTGLPNRRSVQAELDRQLEANPGGRPPLSVAMLDIDHFKSYNDRFGHQGGDRLLEAVSGAWAAELRGGDFAGRYGGEEFLVVLPRCTTGLGGGDRRPPARGGPGRSDLLRRRRDLGRRGDGGRARRPRRSRPLRGEEPRPRPDRGRVRGPARAPAAGPAPPIRPGRPTPPTGSLREASLRSVIDVAADALVLLNVEGTVLGWNRVAEGLFGWTPERGAGKDLVELLDSEELSGEREQPSPARGPTPMPSRSPLPVSWRSTSRDGDAVPVELRLSRRRRRRLVPTSSRSCETSPSTARPRSS